MAQDLRLQLRGLHTNTSPLTAKPGSLATAKNVWFKQPGVLASRNGMMIVDSVTSYGNIKLWAEFQNKAVFFTSIPGGSTSYRIYAESSAGNKSFGQVVSAESVVWPSDFMASVASADWLYFTSTSGIYKTALTAAAVSAGIPKALDGSATTSTSTGILIGTSPGNRYAYRIVWGKVEDDGTVRLGAPSARIDVGYLQASGGALASVDPIVTFSIPAGMTTANFYQIYRSELSGDYTVQGSDEMGLVYQNNPTSGQISAGSITVTDILSDDLRGETIYTAPSRETILQANDPPPLAQDMTFYRDMLFLANTQTPYRMIITYLGGMANGKTITINGVTYTGDTTAENLASGIFKITTGLGVSDNIELTAQSLVRCINTFAQTGVGGDEIVAYYISNFDETPGKILLEATSVAIPQFYATSNDGAAFSPVLPTSGTTIAASNDDKPNRLYFSKPGIYEAFPYFNYIDLGSDDSAIVRILALNDSMFAFKDNGEVWRVVGEDPASLVATVFDKNCKIIGPKTALVLNNQVFAFSSQGVVSVSDAGIAIKSYDIDDLLNTYKSSATVYACANETDRLYMLWGNNEIYVFSTITGDWTRWVIGTASIYSRGDEAAIVSRYNSTMYFSVNYGTSNTSLYAYEQRGTYSDTAPGADGVAISIDVQTNPITCGSPAMMKVARELWVTFTNRLKKFSVYFKSNFRPDSTTQASIYPNQYGTRYGEGTYGSQTYGGSPVATDSQHRISFPAKHAPGLWYQVGVTASELSDDFTLNGLGITFEEQQSERFTK
jgi:hypothetical protein